MHRSEDIPTSLEFHSLPILSSNNIKFSPIESDSAARKSVIVVLDDDPTGAQAVTDVTIVTNWHADTLYKAFKTKPSALYILTNSRSLSTDVTSRVIKEIIKQCLTICKKLDLEPIFVSRGDSTLRGHFPLESEIIADITGAKKIIFWPAFPEAGRVTYKGVHYVSQEQHYVPAANTDYANDLTFGYSKSRLVDYVKTKYQKDIAVCELPLEDIRSEKFDLANSISSSQARVLVCDTICEYDLQILGSAIIKFARQENGLVIQCGPSGVRGLLGQKPSEPISNIETGTGHGLIIIGSHVKTSSKQLNYLLKNSRVEGIEVDAQLAARDDNAKYIQEVIELALETLKTKNVAIYTSRHVISGKDGNDSLKKSVSISNTLVKITNAVFTQGNPKFVLAKGGITSATLATAALKITRAQVLGNLLQGIVSVWKPLDGPAKNIPYIVFPGNVGNTKSLADIVNKLDRD